MKAGLLRRVARVGESLLFCAGLVVLLTAANFVMMPAGVMTDPWSAVAQTKDQADVLALGSSRTYCTVLPMEIWRRGGITALDVTGPVQPLSVTRRYLDQCLKQQRPRVVLVELYMFGRQGPTAIANAHSNLDRMPWGVPRTLAVAESVTATGWAEALIPVHLYHGRWSELSARDFDPRKQALHAYARGAAYWPQAAAVPTTPSFDAVGEEAYQRDLGHVRAMARTCEQNDIKLILCTAPSRWRMASGDRLLLDRLEEDLANEFPSVGYMDMNAITETIGIDVQTDYLDELHLNYSGAMKISQWLADYLVSEYGLQDHRGAAFAERWNDDLAEYDSVFVATP